MKRTSLFRLFSSALFVVLLTVTAIAQQTATAALEGIVTDANGAVVPNAKVSVKNSDTGLIRETTTDTSGIYRLPALPPGSYQLTSSATGFAENKFTGITLTVGQKLNLDLTLKVAAVGETVDVSATASIVETTRTNVAASVNERAVRELPVNGRNFLDFVTLTPGVVRDPRQGDLSFGGQRGTLNSVQIDGVDNNNLFFGQSLGRTGSGRAPYQFSQDAVQEFQVNTNSFSAEFGRAAGGVINVITKSGTNDFHGTGFWFYRDRALNANSLRYDAGLNNATLREALIPNGRRYDAATQSIVGTPVKPPYHFNQFGGNIGGPIKTDKAFFFFNYDGQRSTTNNIVAFGNTPLATDVPGTTAFNRLQTQFGESYARSFNQDVYLGKVDWQLDPNDRLSVRYNRQNFTGQNLENSGATTARERSGNSLVRTDTLSMTLTSTFSARLLNEFRSQLARDKQPGFANSDNPEAEVRERGVTVVFFGRNNFSPRETTAQKYQLIDTITYTTGILSLKAGVDVNIERIKNFFPGLFGGQYVFNSLADFQNNIPSRFSQAFGGAGTTGATSYPHFSEYSGFAQMDARLHPSFTANIGFRYDAQVMRRPPTRNPSTALAAAGIDTSTLNNDYNNLAPRMGFAWRPFSNSDRMVVRGGFGNFFGRTPAILFGTAHTQNGVNVSSLSFNLSAANRLPFNYPGRFNSISDIPCSLFGAAAATCATQGPLATISPNLFVMSPNFRQPYTDQGNLGIDFALSKDLALNVSYLYVSGKSLSRTRDSNLAAPVATTINIANNGGTLTFQRNPGAQGSPTRPVSGFSRISIFESTASSNYNGLIVELRKRFSRNFQGSAAYTWSKVIDDAPDATAVVANNAGDDSKQIQQVFNIRDERGLGQSDIPHRFVLNGLWDLSYFNGAPKAAQFFINGWQVSSILQISSNAPFSARLGNVDLNNDNNPFTDRVPGVGRNTLRVGRFSQLDFRASKNFAITEKLRMQFFAEFFNILNRVNKTNFDPQLYAVSGLGTPNASNVSPATLTRRGQFLTPRGTTDMRIGQLALKLIF
jgi:Carboxypeptidase regulatory-like domain